MTKFRGGDVRILSDLAKREAISYGHHKIINENGINSTTFFQYALL